MFKDPILLKLSKKYPKPLFEDKSEILFEKMIDNIISQQLSVKAADTIFKRFKKLFDLHNPKNVIPAKAGIYSNRSPIRSGMTDKKVSSPHQEGVKKDNSMNFPSPQEILNMPDEAIRTAGISFQKISYLKAVADAFIKGIIDPKKIKNMKDEEVIESLVQIRGVGQWTAEMILIFTLGRPDVFSLGDKGLRNAIKNLYKITDPKKIIKLSEKWKPNRSYASWYLWRSLENT